MTAYEVSSSAACAKLVQFCVEEKRKEVQQIEDFLKDIQTSTHQPAESSTPPLPKKKEKKVSSYESCDEDDDSD